MASGYHFGTQSVSSQSTANSSAAEAADPSTLFYNAAGLTKLQGTQASINLNIVAPNVKYKDAQATYPGTNANIIGQTNGKITEDVVVAPHAYVSHQVNDKLFVGVGAYVPFASATEYQPDSVLRYNLNELGLQTIAIQPTIAYKINDKHSVAAGVVAQHTEANLRQYANFGGFAGQSGKADGYAKVKGDDWGFGYNLAWMWDINDQATVGVNYRSKVSHTLKGDAEWILEDTPLKPIAEPLVRQLGYAAKEDASVKITTPESLSVHGMYKVNPQWNVYGDVTWTRHSRFNQADLTFGNQKTVAPAQTGDMDSTKPGSQSNITRLTPNWRNTYKIALGASYQYSKPLQLRFGVAYDQSPVKNENYRMSTMPDSNRIWLSLGAKYDFNEHHSLNVAYTHIFIKDAKANVNGYCGGENAASVACVSSKTAGSARFKSDANILGLQYTYKF